MKQNPIHHRSRYPKHVPTVAEQVSGDEGLLEKIETKADIARYTAIGVIQNPLTWRVWLEDEYEAETVTERMNRHSNKNKTIAHHKGAYDVEEAV